MSEHALKYENNLCFWKIILKNYLLLLKWQLLLFWHKSKSRFSRFPPNNFFITLTPGRDGKRRRKVGRKTIKVGWNKQSRVSEWRQRWWLNSVWPDVWIKSGPFFPSFQIRSHSSFCLKSDVFQNGPKRLQKYLGYFCKKICSPNL